MAPSQPRYRSVGARLLKAAVQVSLDRGFEGRIGLYSLPLAEGFYTKVGMTRMHVKRDRSSSVYGLRYFEFNPTAAVAFFNGLGR